MLGALPENQEKQLLLEIVEDSSPLLTNSFFPLIAFNPEETRMSAERVKKGLTIVLGEE